jgi:hypothetical protein
MMPFEAVNEVAPLLMSDGTPDLVSAGLIRQLQVNALQVVALVALVEITLEPHEKVVVP